MGGLVRGLFGGNTQKSSNTSQPVDVTPAEFKALRQPAVDALLPLLAGTGVVSGGPFAAGITPDEQAIVSRLAGTATLGDPLTAAARASLTQTLGGEFLSPASNPFLAATIEAAQRPLIEQFKDVTLPRLQGQFTAAGQNVGPEGSSAFDKSAAIATRGLFNELGDISSRIAGDNFQQERGRQIEAAAQATNLTTQEVNTTISSLQAVALPRLIEQLGIDRGVEEFNRRIQVILQAVQAAQGLPLTAIGTNVRGSTLGTAQQGIVPGLLSPFRFTREI